ncbi:hypothetical protein [Rhodococcus pyridinivorans]|uniref:hypothetical protein n=1 Tax=Rhodococcus pyridinivorans TaxID=103816 RepID=UPI003D156DD3
MLSLPRADIDFREDTQNRLRMLLDSHDLDVAFLYDLDLEPGLETSLNDTRGTGFAVLGVGLDAAGSTALAAAANGL